MKKYYIYPIELIKNKSSIILPSFNGLTRQLLNVFDLKDSFEVPPYILSEK